MGALIKKTEARSGRHIFEASGPSLPFPNCQSGGGNRPPLYVAAATIKQVGRNVHLFRVALGRRPTAWHVRWLRYSEP
jgi:hypothetical protein